MARNTSIKILLEHAQKQSDESAKKLGQFNVKKQEAEQKLQILLQYRQDYQSSFHDQTKEGVDQSEWRNFNAFMSKLDDAISEQKQAVTNSTNSSELGGKEFRSCQRKLDSYNILSQRHQKIVDQQQKKHEQKEQDEYSSNKVARSQTSSK